MCVTCVTYSLTCVTCVTYSLTCVTCVTYSLTCVTCVTYSLTCVTCVTYSLTCVTYLRLCRREKPEDVDVRDRRLVVVDDLLRDNHLLLQREDGDGAAALATPDLTSAVTRSGTALFVLY